MKGHCGSKSMLAPTLLLGLYFGTAGCERSADPAVRLFVASSLVDVAEEVAQRYEATHTGVSVHVHHAGSGLLRQQINAGAPCDIFISADTEVSESLEATQAVEQSAVVATNALVLFTTRSGPALTNLQQLGRLPRQRVVLGNPRLAPVGRYAEQALRQAGFAADVIGEFLHVESARHVVATVAAGGADVGLGFATDVLADPRLVIRFRIAPQSHDSIEYRALLLRKRRNRTQALPLLQAFSDPANQDLWNRAGFGSANTATTSARHTRMSLDPVWRSLQVAFWATLLAGTFGLLLARLLRHRHSRRSNMIAALLDLPLVLPPTVIGLLLLLLLGPNGPLGAWFLRHLSLQIAFTLAAAVLASALMALPLMVRSGRAALEAVPRRYAQAAAMAGASRWRVFWTIELPLAKRGILAGVVLTFFRALGEFGATLLVAGNIPGSTQTLPLAIYSASFEGRPRDALVWIVCIALLAFAGAWSAQTLTRRALT